MIEARRRPALPEGPAMDDVAERRPDEPLLSVVAPAFDEQETLEAFHRAVVSALGAAGIRFELVLVDDGSRDRTWSVIRELNARDDRVRGVALSRNFGHQHALFAGLAHAGGDAVVMLDADLQHPPDVIPKLVDEWRRGADVVHAVRRDSGREPTWKRLTARLFYRVFAFLSGERIEPGMADFRLLDRRVVDALLRFDEEGLFLRGLVHWVGYRSSRVAFECGDRVAGRTSYTLARMIRLGWDGITSFSLVPLRMGVVLGLLTSGLAFVGLLQAIYAKVVAGTAVPGWAQAVSITTFLFGVLFILIGLLGEYVGRILIEVRRRPRYLVRDRVGLADAPASVRGPRES